jgi:hypothetical protein
MAIVSSTPGSIRALGAATQAAQENVDVFKSAQSPGGAGIYVRPDGIPLTPHPFWSVSSAESIAANWDQSFPYQLLWLRKKGKAWKIELRYTFPLPPESLTINTPFAIELSVTAGGTLEEHNGAPLRDITLSGTTGTFPLRGAVDKPSFFEAEFAGIFAGTANAVRGIGSTISQAGNLLGGVSTPNNIVSKTEMADGLGRGTGFYQHQLLTRFLEAYVERKRRGDKNLKLGLAIWKERCIYLLKPSGLNVPRTAARPLEYPFHFTATATRRIVLDDTTGAAAPYEGEVGVGSPDTFAKVVSALTTARGVLEGARDVLSGVRADVQQVLFTPLRQATLFAKDAVGTVLAATDFPSDIITDMKEPLLEASATLNAVGASSRQTPGNAAASGAAIQEAFRELAVSTGKADTGSGRDSTTNRSGLFGSGQNKKNAAPANKIMETPVANYSFFSTIRPNALSLRPDTVRKMETERAAVKNLHREDFEKSRDGIEKLLAEFSDAVGAGSATYSRTFKLPHRSTSREPTDGEWALIYAMTDVLQQFDSLAASAKVNHNQVTSLDYVAGLAARSGIAFTVPTSKFAVPFPYGATLEGLAERYLGSMDSWHEIATLNGLRAPYVDEIGFRLPISTNGMGWQVVVADASNLFPGQKVWIESVAVLRETRRVQKIVRTGNSWAVTLDGKDDLAKYTTSDRAFLQGFLAGTVNSQQQIYIPSDAPPSLDEDDFRSRKVPGVDYFDPLVASCGIDWLLTSDNDIIFVPDGSTRLAAGLTNQVQKVRLAIGTPKGSLSGHSDYGVSIKAGESTADVSADQILEDLNHLFDSDPSFTGVKGVSVAKSAGSVIARLTVGIAGTGQYVPLQVDLRQK